MVRTLLEVTGRRVTGERRGGGVGEWVSVWVSARCRYHTAQSPPSTASPHPCSSPCLSPCADTPVLPLCPHYPTHYPTHYSTH